MNEQDKELLEGLIDKYCLCDVIDNLRTICYAKADHIQTNWQDDRLAGEWEDVGDNLQDYDSRHCPNHH